MPIKGQTAWVLIFSILIASAGLNTSSSAVVIGAMLISPLMGPIMGIGLSLGINDIFLLRKAVKNFGIMVGLSLMTSFLYFSIPVFQNETPELIARTGPDVRDVIIAFAGGLALIIAFSRRSKAITTISGVAIATALMPPLCTAGFGLATGKWHFFGGAMFLFSINTIFIATATFIIVRFLKFPFEHYLDSKRKKIISNVIYVSAFVILIPSVFFFYKLYKQSDFNQTISHFIQDQKENTVGKSFESYVFGGKLWALPIDAATPVAAARLDIFKALGLSLPQTFDDLLNLAKKGLVAFAGIPIDSLMSFYMFCCSLGEAPFQSQNRVISQEIGVKALKYFRELAQYIAPENFDRNPIKVYEAMVNTNNIAYCPFAYGYSNYSRIGYSKNLLHFYDLVSLNGQNMTSALGGTGLAVSAFSKHIPEAIKYAEFTGSSYVQQNIFADNGGQPGHLQAWKNQRINNITHQYFHNTLPALDRAFLRPRYFGHMDFQDYAGDFVRDYLMNGGDEILILNKMNELYVKSLNLETA